MIWEPLRLVRGGSFVFIFVTWEIIFLTGQNWKAVVPLTNCPQRLCAFKSGQRFLA
jgi:hypothetical protein